MAVVRGYGLPHGVVECLPIVVLAYFADRPALSMRARSIAASLGLMFCSAELVHLSGGLTEMHFHFFVMLGVISLYQDWRPFLLSVAFVVLHHGVLGAVSPRDVFDSPQAWRHPIEWAVIHGFFVVASCVVSGASWRIIDNSNRAAAEELAQQERRFRAVIEHSADVVSFLDAGGHVLYDSPSCEAVLGYTPNERAGMNGMELVHPDDLPRVTQILERLLRDGGGVEHVEFRCRHRDGHWLWVDVSASNLLD